MSWTYGTCSRYGCAKSLPLRRSDSARALYASMTAIQAMSTQLALSGSSVSLERRVVTVEDGGSVHLQLFGAGVGRHIRYDHQLLYSPI